MGLTAGAVMGIKAAGWAAKTGVQAIRGNKQHERNKELQSIQMGNQAGLNRQGHNLQMDMWNKTNYKQQLEKMKEAGLSPGLMYGGSGASGSTTGSQSGGSAASASAAAPQAMAQNMDISNLMIGAQIELAKSQARKNNVESTNMETGGVVNEQVQADTGLKGEQAESQRLKNIEQKIVNEYSESKINAEIDNYWSVINQRDQDTEITGEKKKAIIKQAYLDNMKTINENTKIKQEVKLAISKTKLTDRQFNQIEAELYVKAEQLALNKRGVDIQAVKLMVDKEMRQAGIDAQNLQTWVSATANVLGNVVKAMPTNSTSTIIKKIR